MERTDAVKKTRQALRENAHDYCPGLANEGKEESDATQVLPTQHTLNERLVPTIPCLTQYSHKNLESSEDDDQHAPRTPELEEVFHHISNTSSSNVIQNELSSRISPAVTCESKKFENEDEIRKVGVKKESSTHSDSMSSNNIQHTGSLPLVSTNRSVKHKAESTTENTILSGTNVPQTPTVQCAKVTEKASPNKGISITATPKEVCSSKFENVEHTQSNFHAKKESNENICRDSSKTSSQRNLERTNWIPYSMTDQRSVVIPRKNDVIGGRDKFATSWNGNILYQRLIEKRKMEYFEANLPTKIKISIEIVDATYSLSPPGRFLKWKENGKLRSSRSN